MGLKSQPLGSIMPARKRSVAMLALCSCPLVRTSLLTTLSSGYSYAALEPAPDSFWGNARAYPAHLSKCHAALDARNSISRKIRMDFQKWTIPKILRFFRIFSITSQFFKYSKRNMDGII